MADNRNPERTDPQREVLEGLAKQVQELAETVKNLEAWKAGKENQQLAYPLDFVSQQIIQSFVSVGGPSFLQLGNVGGFGIYFGEGGPNTNNVFAAQGSLYLRYDGSSSGTRAYINSDGQDTWVSVTTAS